jgi:hypothetical protein
VLSYVDGLSQDNVISTSTHTNYFDQTFKELGFRLVELDNYTALTYLVNSLFNPTSLATAPASTQRQNSRVLYSRYYLCQAQL